MIVQCGLGVTGGDFQELALVSGLLIVALLAALVVGIYIRRRYDPRQTHSEEKEPALTMEQLDAWRGSGKIDDLEFSAMRRTVLGLPATTSVEPTDLPAPPEGSKEEQ